MLGLPPGGFPRSIEGWLERIHPDDHDATMEALVRAPSSTASPFSCEYRLRHGDGSWVTVSDQGVLLTNRSRPRHQHDRRDARRDARARGAGRAARGGRAAPRALQPAQPGHAGRRARRATSTPTPTRSRSSSGTREEMLGRDGRATTSPRRSPRRSSRRRRRTASGASSRSRAGRRASTKHLLLSIVPTRIAGRRGCFLLGADITEQKGDAGGAGALGARAAPPGDDPRRAQHRAQGPARAARAGPARARGAHRLQRRPAHRADARAAEPRPAPPPRAARASTRCAATCARSSARSASGWRSGRRRRSRSPAARRRSRTWCATAARAPRSPRRCT